MIQNDEGLKEKFVRRGFWIYAFSFVIGPIGYLTKIVLSADLSVAEMGVLYGIIGFVTLVGTYNDLGLTEALNYFLPKFASKGQYGKFRAAVTYAIVSQVATSAVLGTAFYLGADFLGERYFKSPDASAVLKVFCLFFLLNNLIQIGTTIYGSLQRTKSQYAVNFLRAFLSLAFVATLWAGGHGNLIAYSWAWVFPLLVTAAWNAATLYLGIFRKYLAGVPADHSDGLFRKVFAYALWTLITANVGVVLSQIDMQLLLFLKGPEAAGYYTNYLSLVGIPFLFVTPIISFLFPVVSGFAGTGHEEKIVPVRRFFVKYFAAAAIPSSFALGLFGYDFAVALFGEKFAESGRILAWSAPFLAFNFLLQINFQILAGTGKVRERLKILLLGLAVNVPLNLLLIPVFGPEGSALAVGLSWIPVWYLSERRCSDFPA